MESKLPARATKSPLRIRFAYNKLRALSRPLLGENFILEEERLPTLTKFEIVHQEVSLRRTPLAISRKYYFAANENKRITSYLRLTLCLNGFQDALELLFSFAEEFQRPLPLEVVTNATEKYQIGDVGLAWTWRDEGEPEIIAFVRNNLLVTIQGHNIEDLTVAIAKEIDGAVKKLRTTDKYIAAKEGIFTEVRRKKGEQPKVPAGGTLTIGIVPSKQDSLGFSFFLATSGSMNRDIKNPEVWYYRAGMQKGKQEITLLRADSGILPIKERLILTIT